jgi:hypothetical protein
VLASRAEGVGVDVQLMLSSSPGSMSWYATASMIRRRRENLVWQLFGERVSRWKEKAHSPEPEFAVTHFGLQA